MSTTADYQHAKYTLLERADASGEIDLEGLTFPAPIRQSTSLRVIGKVGRSLRAFFERLAKTIKETPAEYNARMARRFKDQPPVRGLR